jgi:hypothetical protein
LLLDQRRPRLLSLACFLGRDRPCLLDETLRRCPRQAHHGIRADALHALLLLPLQIKPPGHDLEILTAALCERYCQLADRRPGEDGALFPWRFPLALRGDARFGDLAPHDDRPGTKRAIAG